MSRKLLRWFPSVVVAAQMLFLLPGLSAVAARQAPLTPSRWTNVTGTLAFKTSECGNLSALSAVPGSEMIIAGVALRGLWANTSGAAWSQLGTGSGSSTITNRPSWIVHDPANADVFWESGTYNGGGVYKTTDSGKTFKRLGSIAHIEHMSVHFGDPERRLLLAGGHEQSQTVYLTVDGGQKWTNIGSSLPPNTQTSYLHVINSQTYLVSSAGSGGPAGIYRTRDAGTSWQKVSALGPNAPPLATSNGSIYWPVNGTLLKSTNYGSTWTQTGSNVRPIPPIELPDRRLVASGPRTLIISADGGVTWAELGPPVPFEPAALVYSPNRKAFFISHWNCGGFVLPDAVSMLSYAFGSPPNEPRTR